MRPDPGVRGPVPSSLPPRNHGAGTPKEAPGALGIVINPGALSHYSLALYDCLQALAVPTVEVHLSNIHAREEFRSKSVTARAARGVIMGLGFDGYSLAMDYLAKQ